MDVTIYPGICGEFEQHLAGCRNCAELARDGAAAVGFMERAAEVEKKTYRESLQNNVERIRMSQRLATIEAKATWPAKADQPTVIAGTWNADLKALAAQSAIPAK